MTTELAQSGEIAARDNSFGLREARKRLPELSADVASGKRLSVEFTRRDKPTAVLVGHERFSPLLEALDQKAGSAESRTRSALAWLVAELWLGSAAPHLRRPQLTELQRLGPDVLFRLLGLTPDAATVEVLINIGLTPTDAERMLKRRSLALAIKDAERLGLYDASESMTSAVLETSLDN
jgi:antitoxin (DNA-binding transcriptional repressor) of toxin-antitoxin stability system